MFNHIKQRNLDLKRACRRQIPKTAALGESADAYEFIRMGVDSPAPSYYISYGYALRRLNAFFGGKLRLDQSPRSRMIRELADRCRTLMERHSGLCLGHALSRVLHTGNASSFFLSFKTAKRIFYTKSV